MPCYSIHISGAVFKTGFRYYLKAKADISGIKGTVYYKSDTSVGVIAVGSHEQIRRFMEFCSVANPFFKIHQIEIAETSPGKYHSFEVSDDIKKSDPDRTINNNEH